MSLRRRTAIVVSFFTAWLFAAAAATADSPAGMLLPGEKVRDTLSSDGESRTTGFAGLAGMRLGIVAKGLPKSRAKPSLDVLTPAGVPVVLGNMLRTTATSATVKKLPLDTTGVWRITVSTPAGQGGAFELSVAAKAPTKAVRKGTTTGTPAVGEVGFEALPGTVLKSLVVRATGKPAWSPLVEIVGPDGRSLAQAVGTTAATTLRNVVLPDHGTYRVVVRGGPGAFTATANLAPPRKAARTWAQVEAPPELVLVSPLTVQNDAHVDFVLTGVGFSTAQSLQLVQGAATRFVSTLTSASTTGAALSATLPGLDAGEYELVVSTPSGNISRYPVPVTVTNRPPGVTLLDPPLFPTGNGLLLNILGAGFDATAQVSVRRRSDGAVVPASISSRQSHTRIDALLSPPPYLVGPCDLEVRDPDGSGQVLAGVLDVVGWRAAPAAIRTYTGSDQATSFWPRDAAFDPATNRACIAVQEGTSCVWLLVDVATWTVLDTVTVTPGGIPWRVWNPRVTWNPVDGTWAFCWTRVHPSSTDTAYVRIVDGANIRTTRAEHVLGSATYVAQVHAAADPVQGGWVVVHDRWNGGTSYGEIWAMAIAADGTGNTASQTKIADDRYGLAYEASIVPQASDRFVVAYLGADDLDAKLAIRRMMLRRDATIHTGSTVCAGVGSWQQIFQPELALNPEDGSMLLAFSYLEDDIYHPASLYLAPESASPGPIVSLDDSGVRPQGFVDSLVWNPSRREFVIALTTAGYDVTLRRLSAAGAIKPSFHLQSYEGIWGILWSGPAADSMHLVRAFDGTVDGNYGTTGSMMVHGGPVR